jgi:endonuclease YncB( thermonuclease family)
MTRPGHPRSRARSFALQLLLYLLAALVIAGFVYWRLIPHGLSLARQPVKLVRVSDGDTIVVRDSRGHELKVRLAVIDTPELGTAAAFRSALYTAELLENARRIELELEPTAHRAAAQDRYDRLLGWVWVTRSDGHEVLLQEELLRAGLAEVYSGRKHGKYLERLLRLR